MYIYEFYRSHFFIGLFDKFSDNTQNAVLTMVLTYFVDLDTTEETMFKENNCKILTPFLKLYKYMI